MMEFRGLPWNRLVIRVNSVLPTVFKIAPYLTVKKTNLDVVAVSKV